MFLMNMGVVRCGELLMPFILLQLVTDFNNGVYFT